MWVWEKFSTSLPISWRLKSLDSKGDGGVGEHQWNIVELGEYSFNLYTPWFLWFLSLRMKERSQRVNHMHGEDVCMWNIFVCMYLSLHACSLWGWDDLICMFIYLLKHEVVVYACIEVKGVVFIIARYGWCWWGLAKWKTVVVSLQKNYIIATKFSGRFIN